MLSLGFDSISTYGLLKDRSKQNVRDIISYLIADGYLQAENGDFPVLSFTERTMPFLRAPASLVMRRTEEKAAKTERIKKHTKSAELTNSDLFEELRTLRRAIADEDGVPPYVVFSDKTLTAMCDMLPSTDEDFLDVPGIGATKLERYGDAFITAINDWKLKRTKK